MFLFFFYYMENFKLILLQGLFCRTLWNVFYGCKLKWHHIGGGGKSPFLLSWFPPLECSLPQRQLLCSAPTCWFRVGTWEWQHEARTLSDECQHSSRSLSGRQEANRQAAGSSQAWRGLLDRVQNSRGRLSATPQNSCGLNSGSLHTDFSKSSPSRT